MVDDEVVGRGPTTAPAPLRVPPGRWGACGGRPHGRVDGDRVSRAIGGVLRSTREEGPVCVSRPGDVAPVTINGAHRRPLARLRPRSWGVGRSRRGRPAGRDPALAPVRAARSGCWRRRTVRHPGSSPVRAARPARPRGRSGWGDPGRGLPRPRRRGPSRPGPLVPAASHCGPRHHSPNSNRSRASLRAGASQEPPPRQGTHPHPGAPQSARSPGNPRARHLTHEIVT